MSQPWWRTDNYIRAIEVPPEFEADWAGPNGVALVRSWPDGTTDNGWGLPKEGKASTGFMHNYMRGKFRTRAILYGFERQRWNFAFIMRSMRLICIDIDGKNGGLQGAGKLGMLPPTLAETSKSGDGYHLFYAVSEDMWDPELGFGMFTDRIGIEQGVDIRATGCVYHHPQQRWNEREIAELPAHLRLRLIQKKQEAAAQAAAIIKVLDSGDQTEVILMHDALITDLAKPIQSGKRNTTLFAIGSQMLEAKVPQWDELVFKRAVQVGLDKNEADKLVSNITRYGAAHVAQTKAVAP